MEAIDWNMGKQIEFFFSKKTKSDFISFVFRQKFKVFSESYDMSNGLKLKEYSNNDLISDRYLLFYKEQYGNLFYNQGRYERLNVIKSPVIEFVDTSIHDNNYSVNAGRIWISQKNVFTDESIGSTFISDYNILVKWIKKNVSRQEYYDGCKLIKGYIDLEIKEKYEYKYRLL